MYRRSIAVAMMALGMLLAAAVAHADTGDIIQPQNEPANAGDGWQSGTCTSDAPTKCSPNTPAQFFKQAGGHPAVGFTQFIIKHGVGDFEPVPGVHIPLLPIVEPYASRNIKEQRVDLPPGLTVNPEATTEKCSLTDFRRELEIAPGVFFHVPACTEATRVGTEEVTVSNTVNGTVVNIPGLGPTPVPKGFVGPPSGATNTIVKVFNLEPEQGEPALFGFFVGAGTEVLLRTEVSWESDYHESFTIEGEPFTPPFATLISRLVNNGKAGNGTFISTPTTCFDHEAPGFEHLYSTWFTATSFGEEDHHFPDGSTAIEAELPENENSEGCDQVPFEPSIAMAPGTTAVDSPASPTVTTELDVTTGADNLAESHLRKAVVTMPAGMGLNPSGSVGLKACTDEQFRKGERVEGNNCPAASEVGTAEVTTPVLSETLTGKIYVGEQKSSDPTSGEEFRVLVEAKSETLGIDTKLIGNVSADPNTGQLTATFDEQETGPLAGQLPEGLPQTPFESVVLKFDGTNKVLSTPPTCSASTTNTTMEPWSDPAKTAHPSDSFTLSSIPGGGTCPTSLAQRPFAPAYTAKSDSTQAGAFSPFRVHIARPDGQQELKVVDATLPKGVTGRLAGIPYCGEGEIAAARNQTGQEARSEPICPGSFVGHVTTESGTGANPLKLTGRAYLAGPYKGAALSLVSVTPAVSGPFDLGTVVVRVALNVDPNTAQIHAVSDVIPDVFGGVKLDIRTIDFNMDRPNFTLNPTNCGAGATTGKLNGGGADPTNPAAFSSYAFNTPFQASGCDSLGFKPKLTVTLNGKTTRAKYQRLTAVLEARKGDANIASTSLALPHAFFVAQEHIKTVCTRPQLASNSCPASSVYGVAEAESPLLDDPLSGNVYLVPGGHKLPDLVADLRGQVNVQLHGVISSQKGGIKTTFDSVPDVAVRKFVLKMAGGKKSLIVNSTNICKGKQLADLRFTGQNGKKATNKKFKLSLPNCAGKKKHRKHKKH